MADFLTFADIYAEIEKVIKHFDSSQTNMVKAMANMVYLDELMVADDLYPLYWLVDFDDSLKSVAPATITILTDANPGVATAVAHGFKTGDLISIHNVVGMTEVNDRIYYVTYLTDDTLSIVDTSGYTAYTSGGTIHHRGKTLATTGKNVQRILEAGWCDHGKMEEITPQEIEADTAYHYNEITCRPQKYYHGKSFTSAGVETNQMLWFPGADAEYILRYWLEKRASPLVADANVPLLPPQFHHAIVAGAVMRLAESKVQVDNAVVWPSIYAQQIKALVSFNRRYYEEHEALRRGKPYLL